MAKEAKYSTFQVVKILRVKRERLREWLVKGFVTPTKSATGTSKAARAVFTTLDLCCIELFKELVEAGVHREVAAPITKNCRSYMRSYLNSIGQSRQSTFMPQTYTISTGVAFRLDLPAVCGLVLDSMVREALDL